MYREMRRKDREMPYEKAEELLNKGEFGVLSTVGADGQPYAVPISYVVKNGSIYFHCARTGQKLDNLFHEPRICFCIVGGTCPVYEKNFSTYYESVIVYGKASKVEDHAEKTDALMMLARKYLPDHMDKAPADIARSLDLTAVYRISIDRLTGKEKRKKPE